MKGTINYAGGVTVSLLVSSAVYCGFGPNHVNQKTIKLEFAVSPLNVQQKEEGANTDGLGIRINVCLPTNCCFRNQDNVCLPTNCCFRNQD